MNMSEHEEVAKLVDGAYKNILERFNPSARQLISAGKAYLKALHGAVSASKAYIDALSELARHANQGTWGGCADIGTALMQLVDIQKEIESQQMNILKAFYVDLLVPLESNIDKDTKVVACEQKRFMQQHRCLQESLKAAAATVKKQRKKSRSSRGPNIDKEIRNIQALEEEKMKLDCFCERSLKQAIIQERRRFGFVLERQCSLTKHNLVYYSQGQNLLQHRLEEWEDVAKGRESMPEPIDKLFTSTNDFRVCGEYASSNIILGESNLCLPSGGGTLRKTRSIDASCLDLRGAPTDPPYQHTALTRAKSDFSIASSSASLASDDYGANHLYFSGTTLRPKCLMDGDAGGGRSRVRALYSYLSSGEHQLSFHEGDIISLLGSRNKGWHYGENERNHRCGWFPIAYTEPVCDDLADELEKTCSFDEDSYSTQPYCKSVVTRSKTAPAIHPCEYGPDSSSAGYASSASSPLSSDCMVPPVPVTIKRPFSTFVDSSRNFDSFQPPANQKLLHPTTRLCSGGGECSPIPASTSPSGSSLVPSESLHPRRPPPSSLHGSNDSGFCNDGNSSLNNNNNTSAKNHNPPSYPILSEPPPFEAEPPNPKENMFASVKLRKVITNDRSAPMLGQS